MSILIFLTCGLLVQHTQAAHSVLDFGAAPSALECDTPTAFANTDAFRQAIAAANSSLDDRVVHIPKMDQGQKLYMMPILM